MQAVSTATVVPYLHTYNESCTSRPRPKRFVVYDSLFIRMTITCKSCRPCTCQHHNELQTPTTLFKVLFRHQSRGMEHLNSKQPQNPESLSVDPSQFPGGEGLEEKEHLNRTEEHNSDSSCVDPSECHGDDALATITVTTYAELTPYIEELIGILEEVYEVGKSSGEKNLLKNIQFSR